MALKEAPRSEKSTRVGLGTRAFVELTTRTSNSWSRRVVPGSIITGVTILTTEVLKRTLHTPALSDIFENGAASVPADGGAGVPGPDQAPGAYNPSPDCSNADGTGVFDTVREIVAEGNLPSQEQIDAAQKCSNDFPGHFESVTAPDDVHEIIVYGRPPH